MCTLLNTSCSAPLLAHVRQVCCKAGLGGDSGEDGGSLCCFFMISTTVREASVVFVGAGKRAAIVGPNNAVRLCRFDAAGQQPTFFSC